MLLARPGGMRPIFGLVDQLKAGLDYHQERHAVLASNLANVDTPHFRPRELERTDRPEPGGFGAALGAALETTQGGHQGGATGILSTRVVVDRAATPDADGNAVSIDREAVKIAANHIRYETLSTLVASSLGGLSWAAGDGRGA